MRGKRPDWARADRLASPARVTLLPGLLQENAMINTGHALQPGKRRARDTAWVWFRGVKHRQHPTTSTTYRFPHQSLHLDYR